MNILVAPDSFKECLDAFAVAEAIAAGLRRGAAPAPEIVCRPLADGGEGMMRVLCHALGGKRRYKRVSGPLGTPVRAGFGLLDGGRTAVIEMAEVAGLHLLARESRNPLLTTTRGVGELMSHVLGLGVERIIVGLGGSATNDGGAGMAQALGASFLDASGRELPPGGAALSRLSAVDVSALDKRLGDVEIIAACDVANVLCGPMGASRIYGPQKGASPADVKKLDGALNQYAAVVRKCMNTDMRTVRGGGAAGGLAAGLSTFAGAKLRSGTELVFEAYGDMEEKARDADFIISGEGAVDGQTSQGKVVAGVAALARRHRKPLFVLAGCIAVPDRLDDLFRAGVTGVFPIAPGPVSREEAIRKAASNLEHCAMNLVRAVTALSGGGSRD